MSESDLSAERAPHHRVRASASFRLDHVPVADLARTLRGLAAQIERGEPMLLMALAEKRGAHCSIYLDADTTTIGE